MTVQGRYLATSEIDPMLGHIAGAEAAAFNHREPFKTLAQIDPGTYKRQDLGPLARGIA